MRREMRDALGHAVTWTGLAEFVVLTLAVGLIISWQLVLS